MSGYLLDTHVLLWALTAPERLGAEASAVVRDVGTTLVVSAASAWEISTKHRLGRLPGADPVLHGYHRHLRRLGADELAISSEHALLAGALDWHHGDPFDRVLAAQSMVEGLTLVTADAELTELAGVRTIW